MNKSNRYSTRPLGKKLLVSNDTRITHCSNNDLIIGSSGSSKTGSIVYSQLKSLEDSSLVVVDTKSRLQKMFKRELEAKGFAVYTVDFVNPHRSAGYNPFCYIRRHEDGSIREQDIVSLAKALLPDCLDEKEKFWVIAARTYLEFPIAFTVSALPREDHNMITVGRLHRTFMKEMGVQGFLKWIEDNPQSFAGKKFEELNGWKNAEKMTSSINAFVTTAVTPFDTKELEYIFGAQKSIDLKELGRKKTVLFLNISDSDHSQDVLVNLLYTSLFQCLIAEADENKDGQLKVPVRIIMDDFASGATIDSFDKIISVVRSRDIWLTLCCQSMSQLYSLYSEAQALTIINNCDHIVYLGGMDLSTAQFIATHASRTPENILCMPRDKQYVLEAGKHVVLMEKIPSYSYGNTEKV